MGSRYSKLPSEVLRNADSFDITVFDVAKTMELHQAQKHNKQVDNNLFNEEDLKSRFEQTVGRKIEN